MRTTMLVLVCSFAGCAPVGNTGGGDSDGPDAGVDGNAASAPCTDIEVVTKDLSIASAAGFTNLPNTCWKLDGKLTLSGDGITSVAKLGDLRGVTDLELNDTALTTFDSKATIEVSGELWLRYNDKLTDIGKLTPKATVEAITVEHNLVLTNLGGIAKATIVAGATTILDNPKLTAINLGAAQRLEGGLTVRDNGAATALDLKTLQSAGAISIANNAALSSIAASALLSNIHGTLTIDNNDALVSLGSFGSAVTIDTNVVVTGNARLTDIGQLARANRVFGIVQISSNTVLDPTRAHDVGCCVATAGFTASNNKSTQCTGDHWCLDSYACYR